jgi:hypothetical protein
MELAIRRFITTYGYRSTESAVPNGIEHVNNMRGFYLFQGCILHSQKKLIRLHVMIGPAVGGVLNQGSSTWLYKQWMSIFCDTNVV